MDIDTVIAVDLDGTLTYTDTLYESVIRLFHDRPIDLLALPLWLMDGKAALKAKVADRVLLNPQSLPYNLPLIEWLKENKASGRKLVLCTAADKRVADAIANHLDLFDYVIGSNGITNNGGSNKREILEAQFGIHGFDYVGNSSDDLEVWVGARKAVVVNATACCPSDREHRIIDCVATSIYVI